MENIQNQSLSKKSKGNIEALSELFIHYYEALFHYGIRIVNDRYLVEDNIQELFVTLYESKEGIDEIHNVKAYLYISLRRRLVKAIKQQQTQKDIEHLSLRTNVKFSVDDLNDHSDQYNEVLVKHLNNLPWRQREALYLRYYNRLSTREISNIMGVVDQTVLNTLYNALKKIRKMMMLFV